MPTSRRCVTARHLSIKSNARAIDQENYRNDHKVEASTLILQNDCELIVSAKSRYKLMMNTEWRSLHRTCGRGLFEPSNKALTIVDDTMTSNKKSIREET